MMLRAAFPSAYRRRAILLGLTGLTLAWPQAVEAAALPSQADRAFLAWDIQIEIQQQDMGRLAEKRGQTAEVRTLGTYLIDRHQQAQQRLQGIADRLKVTLSTRLSPTHLRVQQRYASISDATFDKAFVRHEVGDYRYFLSHFEAASQTQNQIVHDYCAGEIPRLTDGQTKIVTLMQAMDGGPR
jgi:putative membrane protein